MYSCALWDKFFINSNLSSRGPIALLFLKLLITPAMAREVIQACQERNIDCIVAPYEADAQLAFLNLSGIAQFVITEGSISSKHVHWNSTN